MDNILQRLQSVQIEILNEFSDFCRENHLKYSLYFGTLLGAARHQGFIPWDDDLDVCMPREDYQRLIALWKPEQHPAYLLQNKENSPGFTQSFTKIRKKHTTFLQDEAERGKYHTGIFIDIFPIDRIPAGKAARFLFRWRVMVYQLLTREFVPPESGTVVRLGSRVILQCIPKRFRSKKRKKLEQKICRYGNDPTLQMLGVDTMESLGHLFPPNLFDNLVELPFENQQYSCFADWDGYLRNQYGDYMQQPPEKERVWTHHPMIIDFQRDLAERMKAGDR